MRSTRVLALLTAVALTGIAVVHLRIADSYGKVGDHPLSIGDQFYAQSGAAILLALVLVVRPRPLAWAVTILFAAGALGVLVYSRYRCLPLNGFDGCFTESWDVEGARQAAWAEAAALGLSVFGWVSAVSAAGSRARPVHDADPY